MEEIRNYIFSDYDIVDNKILMNSIIVENKYLEIDGQSYDLLQILFYFKNNHLSIAQYFKECDLLDIKPVDSHVMYKLSNISPKESFSTSFFSIQYDFKFILHHLFKKEYRIIVPFSPSSPINIFNCKTILSTGDSRLPPFTKKQLIDPQRSTSRSMDNHKAFFHFTYKQPSQHNKNGIVENKGVNSDTYQRDKDTIDTVVAIFMDDREWWHNQFNLNEYNCPIFKIINEQHNEYNENTTIRGKPVKPVYMNGDRLNKQCIYDIWEDIEQFINTERTNRSQ